MVSPLSLLDPPAGGEWAGHAHGVVALVQACKDVGGSALSRWVATLQVGEGVIILNF